MRCAHVLLEGLVRSPYVGNREAICCMSSHWLLLCAVTSSADGSGAAGTTSSLWIASLNSLDVWDLGLVQVCGVPNSLYLARARRARP